MSMSMSMFMSCLGRPDQTRPDQQPACQPPLNTSAQSPWLHVLSMSLNCKLALHVVQPEAVCVVVISLLKKKKKQPKSPSPFSVPLFTRHRSPVCRSFVHRSAPSWPSRTTQPVTKPHTRHHSILYPYRPAPSAHTYS